MRVVFRVDDTNLRRKVNKALKDMEKTTHPKHPLPRLDAWAKRELGRMWRASNVTRNSRVGTQTWSKFKPPPDPPWGGRPKKRGTGKTLGRLRPSGRRLTPQSRQLIDTWALYRATINTPPDIVRNTLRLGRKALATLRYAGRQFEMRPLSWPAGAQQQYRRFGKEWLAWIAQRWNADRGRVTR